MSNPKLPRPKTMMFISALLCIALVPLVYAVVNSEVERQRRFDKIANMTESERRQLNYNFKEFQKLSPEKQEQYRELYAQLDGEYSNLKTVLFNYNEFLRSLDPVDRAEIERQKEFWGKTNAIKNVTSRLNDESQRYQELLQQSIANNQRKSNWNNGHRRAVPLNPNEIEALTRVLESHQPLKGTQRTELSSLKGVDRLAKILSIVLTSGGGSERKPFFNSQLVREMIASLSEERQEYFHGWEERHNEAERKFEEEVKTGKVNREDRPFYLRRTLEEHFEMMLIGTCLFTFNHELDEAAPPPEGMPAFLQKLDPDVRDELLTKHSGNLYDELVKEYYNRNPNTLSTSTKTVKELFYKRIPKGSPRGRPGGGSGRPGDGRERPGEFQRPDPDGNSDREPRGAGFPDRFRNFRNGQREDPNADDSETQASED